MSDAVLVALISAVVTIITGFFSLVTVLLTRKHLHSQDEVQAETQIAVAKVEHLVNGKSEKLEAKLEAVTKELSRVNREGTSTPEEGPGVTESHGVVNVQPEGEQ